MNRHTTTYALVSLVALLTAPATARAQDKDKDKPLTAEQKAAMARRGAGFTVASWALLDDPASGSTTSSDSPLGEGYFRKGMDKHLAIETTAGLFRRLIVTPGTGGPFGTAPGKTTVILIPQLTSLKLYPFTTPDSKIEPFISAGVGFTIGFLSESGGGGLVGGGGGTGLIPGVGAGLATGVEWRFSKAFGLAAGGHYSYIQFFEELGGEKLYRGTGLRMGMTYRFQY